VLLLCFFQVVAAGVSGEASARQWAAGAVRLLLGRNYRETDSSKTLGRTTPAEGGEGAGNINQLICTIPSLKFHRSRNFQSNRSAIDESKVTVSSVSVIL